jgi:pyridoxamine 5'-phosphate oxidase
MASLQHVINTLRKDYAKEELLEQTASTSPIEQFHHWFEQALKTELPDANAFSLATISNEGYPSSRIVLLRNFDADGFIFYTNYESQKGLEIQANPRVAMNFFWPELEKQIRIEGLATKVSEEISKAYFESRPRESQIGAWASKQSSLLKSRQELSEKFSKLSEKYKDQALQKPPFWGGFIIAPIKFEFWQGRPNRLHDRLTYTLEKDGNWIINRIAP